MGDLPQHRAPTPRSSPPQLLGRYREQQRLAALLAAAEESRGHLALVSGEAGIGKTALVRFLAASALAQGVTVLVGRCYDFGATPPYGPWRELLAQLHGDEGISPLPIGSDGNGETGGQVALFRQVLATLAAVTSDRPAVAVLEDLHWSDLASLDLLRFLGQQVAELPLLFVVTYRSDEITRRHPLAQILPALVREAPTERLDLHPLDAAAMQALIAARYRLRAPDEARLVAYLDQHAEGNPFYAEELLRDLEEAGVLYAGEPTWTLGNLEQVRVPTLLLQVLEGRIARLGEAARDRLAVAAVIGERVSLALWQAVAELTEDFLLPTVEQAVEAHLLEAESDGEHVRFTHALVREALYEGILPPRRRVWHRRVAEVLMSTPLFSAAADPDTVAYHLDQAGDPRAADWLVRAGERARRAYAWMTAKERFAAAAAKLEGDPSRAAERGWLLYRTGRLLRFADPVQGIAYLEEAERVARVVNDPVLAAYALYDRGTAHWLVLELEMSHGVAAMEAGAAALDALPAEHLRASPTIATWIADALPVGVSGPGAEGDLPASSFPVTFRRGSLVLALATLGRFAEAEEIGQHLMDQVARSDRPDALVLSGVADVEFGRGLVAAALGHPAEARAALQRARTAARAIDHHFEAALTLTDELREVAIPYLTTDIALRRSLLRQAATEWARAIGALPSDLAARLGELDVLLLEGEWDRASEIASPFGEAPLPFNREFAVMALGSLGRWRGESAVAWAQVRAWLPNGPATEPGGLRFRFAVALQRLAVDLALDAGDLTTAAAWLAAHDCWMDWAGAMQGRADGRLRWARYALLAGDLAAAREAAAAAVVLATDPAQPLALLAANRLRGEIETAAGDSLAAEPPLVKALSLADACAAPFERALTLLAFAELRAIAGDPGEAARLLDEVRAIARPMGAAPTLERAEAVAFRLAVPLKSGPAAQLSPREVEVLRLVAAGRSNPEVARELFISERTVTTHLTRIYEKLAVAGRAHAVEVALRRGLI